MKEVVDAPVAHVANLTMTCVPIQEFVSWVLFSANIKHPLSIRNKNIQ